MIAITIELWPFGSKERAKLLGRIEIENDGTGTFGRGNYRVRLYKFDGVTVWREGVVRDFDRVRKGGYDLLQLALASALRHRNGHVTIHEVGRNSDET